MSQAWKTTLAILLCTCFWFIAESVSTPVETEFEVSQTTFSFQVLSEGVDAATIHNVSNASNFTHLKQLPHWQFVTVLHLLFSSLVADDSLATEPIIECWFVFNQVSRLRISGWKDSGFQFRLINAFL